VGAALLYDRERLAALRQKTAVAIAHFDSVGSDEPMAQDAIATIRRISFRLSTIWLPWFDRALGNTSMEGWGTSVPSPGAGVGRTGATVHGLAGGTTPTTAIDLAIVDEMVDLTEAVLAGDHLALVRLNELLTENPVLRGIYRYQLGPDGFEAFTAYLEDAENFPNAAIMVNIAAARSGVLDAFDAMPGNPFWYPVPSGSFSLADSVSPNDGRYWLDDVDPNCAGYYRGGGYVTGPDGQDYPIVIPWSVDDDGTVHTAEYGVPPTEPSAANLNGADAGWEIVGYECGVERFLEAPDLGDQFAVWLGSLAGVQPRPLPPNSGLAGVLMSPFGPPVLTAAPPAAAPALPPGGSGNVDPANNSNGSVVGAATGLIARGVGGVNVAVNLDNQSERAYQVIFEHNADGRTRARIQTFTLVYDERTGETLIWPEHVYVNDDGELTGQTISYEQPPSGDPPGTAAVPGNEHVIPYAMDGGEPITYEIAEAVFP
jgi:hypothetical protein